VFVDPLDPQDGEFWEWADERCRGRAVAVLETIAFHRRSREQFIARYGAAREPPAAVVAIRAAVADETLYWLPEHRALIPGDSLIERGGELALCPASWLAFIEGRPTLAAVAAELRELVPRDVELVLVSHGEPVIGGAREALARALDAAPRR